MAQRSFAHDISIQVPPDVVYSFLAAQVNHIKIHPLIVSIEELPAKPEDGATRRYVITDRLKFGFITWPIQYRSAVTPGSAPGELILEAFQPILYLRNITRCSPEGDGTHLTESVSIEAPAPLMGYVFQQAKDSHQQMLTQLKSYLEAV